MQLLWLERGYPKYSIILYNKKISLKLITQVLHWYHCFILLYLGRQISKEIFVKSRKFSSETNGNMLLRACTPQHWNGSHFLIFCPKICSLFFLSIINCQEENISHKYVLVQSFVMLEKHQVFSEFANTHFCNTFCWWNISQIIDDKTWQIL
jgi:hypothetical protein